MDDGNYKKLVSIISKSSGLNAAEIEEKVVAKRERISGLISKEGAAQIIAAELGISFDNERMKIEDLLPGMKKVNLVGKVIYISPVRTFTRKDQEGKVVNLTVADETSNIRVVLWDLNHIELIEKGTVSNDSVVEILNGGMRDNELHLGSFSEFKKSDEVIGDVKTERIVKKKNISDFSLSDNASTRAFVVQAFEPRAFNVCSECKKKVSPDGDAFNCLEHGKNPGEKRILMNLVLDDGTESIRTVLFHDTLQGIGFTEIDDPDVLSKKKEDLLGKEMMFSGSVRFNKFSNGPEFIINDLNDVSVDELVSELENN